MNAPVQGTFFMGLCVEYPGQGIKQLLSQAHTLAVAVFTVTVLWKAAAAMSSHPTICQRGCFSILGIGSEIHRPIHTSQIDMLAQAQAITNINSEMAQESVQCTVNLPNGWISVRWSLYFQPQHLVFSFPFLVKLGVL